MVTGTEVRPARRLGAPDPVRPVVLFAILSYLFSWSYWIPLALDHRGVVDVPWETHFPGLLGPMVAALVTVALVDGQEGVRDLLSRMVRVPARWWWVPASIGGPLLLFVLALPVAVWMGQAVPSAESLGVFPGLPAAGPVGIWILLLLVNGLGEETGWRGFAQDRLQRWRSPLGATAVVALVWGGWHLPLFAFHESYLEMSPAMIAGWWVGLLLGGAVVLAWLYNRAARSVLLAAGWHASYNWAVATEGAEGIVAVVVSAAVMLAGVAILAAEVRARRRGGRSVIDPRRPARPVRSAGE